MSLRPSGASHVETVILSQKSLEDWISIKSDNVFGNVLDDLKIETVASCVQTKFKLQKRDAYGWFREECRDQDSTLETVFLKKVQVHMVLRNWWTEKKEEVIVHAKEIEDVVFDLLRCAQKYTKAVIERHDESYFWDTNKWVLDGVGIFTVWEARSSHDPMNPPPLKKRRL